NGPKEKAQLPREIFILHRGPSFGIQHTGLRTQAPRVSAWFRAGAGRYPALRQVCVRRVLESSINNYGCSRTTVEGAPRTCRKVAACCGAGVAGPGSRSYAPEAPGPCGVADGLRDPDVPVRRIHARVDVCAAV